MEQQYPAMRFLLRYGGVLAAAMALLVLALGVIGFVLGWGWPALAGAVVLAPLVWLGIKDFTELNQIIADMLLPK